MKIEKYGEPSITNDIYELVYSQEGNVTCMLNYEEVQETGLGTLPVKIAHQTNHLPDFPAFAAYFKENQREYIVCSVKKEGILLTPGIFVGPPITLLHSRCRTHLY